MATSLGQENGSTVAMVMRNVFLDGHPIRAACSNEESVVMTTFDGYVYCCGLTDINDQTKYVKMLFPSLNENKVEMSDVCCGGHHFLALSSDGRVYSWGSNHLGQLGILKKKKKRRPKHGAQINQVSQPVLVKDLAQYDVIKIACGEDHSLALTRDGRLFSWGSNSHGQLGLETRTKRVKHHREKPLEVESLHGVPLKHIAAGGAHSVALSTCGSVYVWGQNNHGQLALQQIEDVTNPVRLGGMSMENIQDVSCGQGHTSFLKQSGRLLVHGVGVDRHPSEFEDWNKLELKPGRPDGFQMFSFMQSTSRHTYLLDDVTGGMFVLHHDETEHDALSGRLQLTPFDGHMPAFTPNLHTDWPPQCYVFDPTQSNSAEQSDPTPDDSGCHVTQDVSNVFQEMPVPVRSPDNDYVESLASSAGAIGGGHVTQDTLQEKPVSERECLMAAKGDAHDDVSALNDMKNNCSGHEVGPVLDESCVTEGQRNCQKQQRTWRRMCSGRQHIFIIEYNKPMEYKMVNQRRTIDTLTAELLKNLNDAQDDITKDSALFQYASIVFSSPACLNASFPIKGTSEVRSLHVDLKAARQAFSSISKNTKLLQMLSEVIRDDLCSNAAGVSAFQESLQFYLMLMECPVFSHPHHAWCRQVIAAVGRSMFRDAASPMADRISGILADWWKFEPMSFRRAILVYRLALSFFIKDAALLEQEDDNFKIYLKVLSALNDMNIEHDILSIKTFYIPNLEDTLREENRRHPLANFPWTSYPFLINLELKAKVLEFHNIVDQAIAMAHEGWEDPIFQMFSAFGLHPPPDPSMCLRLSVNRDDIFGMDVRWQLTQMLTLSRSELQKPLRVSFIGERGVDEGALSMDFFRLVFDEIMDPEKINLFRYIDGLDSSHSPIWFRQDCADTELAKICGLLFGLSLYNKALVPLPFPQLMYAKLLGNRPKSEMDEIVELDKVFADQMTKLINGSEEYIIGCCYGDVIELDNGSKVEVTKDNVHLYVEQKIREHMVPSQFKSFQEGFNRVYNPTVMKIFRPIELEALVMGETHFDWKALEQSTKYDSPYAASHNTIQMFWQVFHNLDDDLKRKFLVFVSGSDRVPVGGLRNLGLTIQPLPIPRDDCDDDTEPDAIRLARLIPVALACDRNGFQRTLRLPMYTSVEVIEDRLIVALSCYDCPFHIA